MEELDQRRSSPVALAGAMGLSLYALYWVVGVVEPLFYRASFLLLALILTFLLYSARKSSAGRVTVADIALATLAVIALGWPLINIATFPYRAATPGTVDLILGGVAILLILEATRRTAGWILPTTAIVFMVYAYLGPVLELFGLGLIAHRGYYVDRLIGTLYMTMDGIFGTPLEVASTYIILFSIFGAVLERSGAGKFFIEWALALMRRGRSGSAPAKAVTVAGLFLGTVSGSGVASTVTLGSVSWPMLQRSGYPPDVAGAVLSAAGIGAIMAPPVMGAAAFLIAEFLNIRYIDVVVMAIIPTSLYYFSIFLMIAADSRRLGTKAVEMGTSTAAQLAMRYWYYFLSIASIFLMLARGYSPFRTVAVATLLAATLSFVRKESRLTPRKIGEALSNGARGTLAVVATTATAGIIVGVVTLTGLGLRISGLIVQLAGGSPFLTIVFAAVAVWMLGLAVPVTASYIIAAVMVAPALTDVGVPLLAAHMFIFYYAVLSEVTPPTALSPFAAAAITGGNPFRTMMLTWKYTLPAFLVPFVFTLTPRGMGVLLRAPLPEILWAAAAAVAGVACSVVAIAGFAWKPVPVVVRVLAGVASALFFYGSDQTMAAGVALALVAAVLLRFDARRAVALK